MTRPWPDRCVVWPVSDVVPMANTVEVPEGDAERQRSVLHNRSVEVYRTVA